MSPLPAAAAGAHIGFAITEASFFCRRDDAVGVACCQMFHGESEREKDDQVDIMRYMASATVSVSLFWREIMEIERECNRGRKINGRICKYRNE